MTNITLSINDETYKKMKQYSEIKWSEFVRKAIEKRIEDLDRLEQESLISLSEELFAQEWNSKEDEVWNEYI